MLDEAAAGERSAGGSGGTPAAGRSGFAAGTPAGGAAPAVRAGGDAGALAGSAAGRPAGGGIPPGQAGVEARGSGAMAMAGDAPSAAPGGRGRKVYRRIEEVSEEELLAALAQHRYRLQPTAASLGVARSSLYDRLADGSGPHTAAALGQQEIAECRARHGGNLDRMVEELRVSKSALKRRIKQLGL
jgi:hypothetical protein